MQAFVDDTETSMLTHVADVPGDVWRQFGVVAQPTFVFIDDDGRSQTFAGALGEAALIDAMAQLAAA
jgi:thioredoxin-related protein